MIHHGDLFDVLPTLEAESVDACVTDPPYGIGFMGKEWDSFLPSKAAKKAGLRQYGNLPRWKESNPNLKGRKVNGAISASQIEYDRTLAGQVAFQEWTGRWASEVLRVLKPGAHLIVCGAPRSFHRMACGLEDAGFEIRDCLSWLYGQGFPKSLNLGDGVGTALKPSWEPCVLARKPFKGSIASMLKRFGTGGLNIDVCRIEGVKQDMRAIPKATDPSIFKTSSATGTGLMSDIGRWPANVILDEEAAAMLDEMTGELTSGDYSGERSSDKTRHVFGTFAGTGPRVEGGHLGDRGGASRFYYVAKPSREERDFGIFDLAQQSGGDATDRTDGSAGLNSPRAGAGRTGGARNIHPTVKPVELMRWLVKLITPVGGTVLDPFMGSGTTGMACRYELREFIGIEREAEYVAIAERRIAAVAPLFETGLSNGDAVDPALSARGTDARARAQSDLEFPDV